MYVVSQDQLPFSVIAREFSGDDHGKLGVSLLLVEAPPGGGPGLHKHAYDEVFVVQEGEAMFVAGDEKRTVRAGEIVVVPAHTPHRFLNTGQGPLRQIDIHVSPRFVTEWLDGRQRDRPRQPKGAAVMRAVRLHAPGGPEQLVYEQIETPQPGAGEALVRVHAAAITRDELDWPIDRLPATPSYEFSGVVGAVAPDVDDVTIGEAVYALSGFDRDGAAAEYTIVPAALLAPKPRTLGHVESAAIPLAALSAWQALFDHGKLAEGQRVLVHGAAGGVGHFAVQLAHRRGAHVVGTASTMNVERARALGADEVIDHTRTRFEDVIEEVDLVFDTVGGERLERSPAVLRPGGRLVSVAEEPSQERSAERGISALYFVVEPNREQLVELARLVDRGDLRPTIDEVFPLAEARTAFERSMRADKRGKIVLRVADD